MNCKQFKERVTGALTAGETTLPAELSAHQQACVDCLAFYESETALFRLMDAGLLAAANQPVPTSFLPGLRARLDEQMAFPRAWFSGWRFSAVGATVVVAIIVGLVWHRPLVHPGLPQDAPVVSQAVGNSAPVVQLTPSRSSSSPVRAPRPLNPVISPAKATETEPEVIVLPEEREAFSRFVATLRVQKDVALALTRPAPAREDVAVEIALINFGNVEVKPLEPEVGE